ncbi:MAG: hypothetical protein PWR27_563 [Petroclostridium sp.]|jgi:hypothetical protein|nr:hypothetical protein [Petroclostridium sp.]
MPNNLVFNGTASQLKTQISGVDGNGNTVAILTDSSGRLDLGTVTVTAQNLDIRPITGTTDSITIWNSVVTVTAENFDIRPITGTTDSITIWNSVVTVTAEDLDIRALSAATDSIKLSSRLFTESYTTVAGVIDSAGIFVQNTGEQSMYSFYVFNTGSNTVTVQLQISPTTTASYFVDDTSGPVGVAAGQKTTLVAAKFLQYTRLFYETSGVTCTFDVYYNAQV